MPGLSDEAAIINALVTFDTMQVGCPFQREYTDIRN